MPLDTFRDLINAVVDMKDVFTVGTVKSVDEAEMTCVITPEDEGQDIEDVPLRIMRYADAVGFTVVPTLNTEAVVIWLDKHRPLIFRVHEWDKIIIQNKEGHGLIIKSGDVLLGIEAGATHPVAWGDAIATYFTALKVWLDIHDHGGPPPTAPSPLVPSIESAEVKVS